jgi:hypothetical protein
MFITSLLVPGAFVPLTVEGTIVVDDTVASCYASFDHDLAHAFMAPVRFASSLYGPTPPKNSSNAASDAAAPDDILSTFAATFISSYVRMLKLIGQWLLPYGRWQADPLTTRSVGRHFPRDLSLIDVADSFLSRVYYAAVLAV